jgi:hypothetical protein
MRRMMRRKVRAEDPPPYRKTKEQKMLKYAHAILFDHMVPAHSKRRELYLATLRHWKLESSIFLKGRRVMYAVGRACRLIAGAILAASVVAAVGMSAANAQQSQTPSVSTFLADPWQLLQQYPDGGASLANAVQQLAVSDPSTFSVLLGLLATANDTQKGAIGQGLAQAAKLEVLINQALAADWQQQIAVVNDPAFETAATNAFAEVQLGAIGGAAGGDAGASLGGQGNGLAGGRLPQDIRSRPTTTQPFTITGNTTGSGATTQSLTFTSSTSAASSPGSRPSSPVSPSSQ